METHTTVGAELIGEERGLDPGSRRVGKRSALNHHEALDGTGYPAGKKGEAAIPLQARIISVVDFYDALLEHRPYRKGMSSEEALAIMSQSQEKFDPLVWKAFLGVVQGAGAAP